MKSSEKSEQYRNALLLRGLVDTRRLAGVFNARKLPGGEFGLCLVCLNESVLNIYDTDLRQEAGRLLYSVELTQVTALKTSCFLLNSYLKFTYQGFDYKLVNCSYQPLYKAIEQAVQR